MKYQGPHHHHNSLHHHQYAYVPAGHGADGDDGCCGLLEGAPEERFVFVGEGRGHYEESMRGNFHYVGPNQGHYEKQRLPPKRTWQRCISITCVVMVCAAVCAVIVWYTVLAPAPLFDCYAGLQNAAEGWSDMKKEYCCENERIGCVGSMNGGPPEAEQQPVWLQMWMWDLSLGIKFTVSAAIMLAIGCCCGACSYNHYLKHHAPRRRSPTEVELAIEMKKLLRRLGARTGELAVTLMWDTIDDIDLYLRLPTGEEISAENPQASGGVLDVDGNHTLEMAHMKPLENISWPEPDPHNRVHPPAGEYTVVVKVYARYQHAKDPNITIALNVGGQQEFFHQRITACCCEVKVCSFLYIPPASDVPSGSGGLGLGHTPLHKGYKG